MGVTLTVSRRQLVGAVLFLALLLFLRWRDRREQAQDVTTAANPLVLGSPEFRVVSGVDTTVIRGPALFAYMGLDPGEGPLPRSAEEIARSFQATVLEAEPALQEMGVRLFSVSDPPLVLGIPPEVDDAAGPRLVPGALGFLLADPPARILRIDKVPGGAALVCAAARTFEKAPPPAYQATCR